METFKKRQKEMLRLEKQREKTARRLAKVRGKLDDPNAPIEEIAEEGAEGGEDTGAAGEGSPSEPHSQASD